MRILLVTDYFPPVLGGMSLLVESLANALQARHNEVYVCTVSGSATPDRRQGLKVERAHHLSSFFPFIFKSQVEKNIPPLPDPLFNREINHIVSRFKPDIIHAHGWVMFSTASYRISNPDVYSVATLHDYGFSCAKRNLVPRSNQENGCMVCPRIEPAYECLSCCSATYGSIKPFGVVPCLRIFSHLLNDLDCVSAVSNYVAERARKKFTANIVTIPNFVDYRATIGNAQKVSKTVDFPPDVLFVGRLSREKGIYLFLKAFEILRKAIPQTKIAIVGKEDSSCSFQINDKSVFHRKNLERDEVSSLYCNSKVVVIPSIWAEPQPMVALEAMAFGKPLVVTAVGGLKEMVLDGKTGFVVEPSPENLAQALINLLANPSAREEMGSKGRERLLSNYTSEIVVPRIEEMYERSMKN